MLSDLGWSLARDLMESEDAHTLPKMASMVDTGPPGL
jgi:hypothetical protein